MPDSLEQFEGKYEILTKLAEGGMGAVYKVRHRLLDEIRVVKVMRPQMEQHQQSKDRFLREARIAVKVRHRNIAQMYDFSIDDRGTAYIVLEFIDGVTLQQILKKVGPPRLPLALEIAQQSLQSLAYIHQKGIVHRDISPDNLMLTRDDWGAPLVKLIDLGIAKLQEGDSNLTGTGVFLGKVRYASPEHFRAQEGGKVDHRSDIYSFGLVLYEFLTGSHPIEGNTWSELIAGHLFQPPRDFAVTDPGNRIPQSVREIIGRAIAKAPEDRFPDSNAFRKVLVAVQSHYPGAEEELEPVLSRCMATPPPEQSPPGAAQDRLDEQLRPEKTASEAGTAAPAVARDPELEQKVEALLEAAQRLVALGVHAEARIQLEALEQFDPGNSRARELLDEVSQAESRDRTVTETRDRVEGLLDDGNIEEAVARLDSVVAKLGAVAELAGLRERIERLRNERRAQAVNALIEEGRQLHAQGRFEGAVACLERATAADPSNLLAQAQLTEARNALQRQDEQQLQATTLDQLPSLADTAPQKVPPAAPTRRLARPPEDATRRFEVQAKPEQPPSRPPPRPRPAPTTDPDPGARPLTGATATASARARRSQRGGPARWLWAASAGALVVVAVITAIALGGRGSRDPQGGPAAQGGTAVVDAVPWAEVIRIVDADGEAVELPDDRFTPLRLDLPQGRYRVSLRRPDGAEPTVVSLAVGAGEVTNHLERFDVLDATSFLGKYGL